MICLLLTEPTIEENLSAISREMNWIDLAELRVDMLAPDERGGAPELLDRVRSLPGGESLKIVFTVRRECDGGGYTGSEEERLDLLHRGAQAGFDYLDIEEDLAGDNRSNPLTDRSSRLADAVREGGGRVVRSIHVASGSDGATAVAQLSERVKTPALRGEIARIVAAPGSTREVLDIIKVAEATSDVQKIVTATGPYATAVTVLAGRYGSLFTSASASRGAGAVEGITPRELGKEYRYRSITRTTRLFGVIGSPIHHSRSPSYHNGRFSEDGIDACYVPFLVDDVNPFFDLAYALELAGFSVTIPHKQTVLDHLESTDDGSRAAGACNTVVRAESRNVPGERRWRGVNTDVEGFTQPLLATLGVDPGGMRAVVIGAGGAARAIVLALARYRISIRVLNRTVERARSLADDITRILGGERSAAEIAVGALEEGAISAGETDLIVQTTSVGMEGSGDPVPWYRFTGSELVYDVIYTPPDTPIIRRAREAGCKVITGDEMFRAQAAAQYRLYRDIATR